MAVDTPGLDSLCQCCQECYDATNHDGRAVAAAVHRWGGGLLLLQRHAELLHSLEPPLHWHDLQAVGLDGLVCGGIRSTNVHDRLTVQHNGVVVVDHGHAVAVHASRYCHLVDKHDFCSPKCLEPVKCLDDFEASGFTGNPCLVFLGIHAAPLDDAEANVDNVAVSLRVSRATGTCHTGA